MEINASNPVQSIDKLNTQRLLDNFAERYKKQDDDEQKLGELLVEFTKFRYTETDENLPKPLQFEKKYAHQFKKYEIPISRATWSVPYVVMHMRTKLEESERGGMPIDLSGVPLVQPHGATPDVNYGNKLVNTLKDLKNKLTKDPLSPKLKMEYTITAFQNLPLQWQNMLHIYNVNYDKRPDISKRKALDRTLSNINLVFDSYVEPTLLPLVSFAKYLAQMEILRMNKDLLIFQQNIAERHEQRQQFMPPP